MEGSPHGSPAEKLVSFCNLPGPTLSVTSHTHIRGLFVIVYVVDIPGQAEVCYLHHIVLCHQHVSGCQISMDTLQSRKKREK